MRDCERGCLVRGQHVPDCGCTPGCPDHKGHCEGCAPKPAQAGNWCQTCATHLTTTLRELPALADRMARMPGGRPAPPAKQDPGDHTRRATKVDQCSPSPAHDLTDEANRWLYGWAVTIADERREAGPFTYTRVGIPMVDTPRAFARYLTERVTHITAQAYAEDLRTEAASLHYQLTQGTGQDTADQPIRKPCPACNRKGLSRPNGQDHVVCRSCKSEWSPEQYAHLAKAVA